MLMLKIISCKEIVSLIQDNEILGHLYAWNMHDNYTKRKSIGYEYRWVALQKIIERWLNILNTIEDSLNPIDDWLRR